MCLICVAYWTRRHTTFYTCESFISNESTVRPHCATASSTTHILGIPLNKLNAECNLKSNLLSMCALSLLVCNAAQRGAQWLVWCTSRLIQ